MIFKQKILSMINQINFTNFTMRSIFVLTALFAGALSLGIESELELEMKGGKNMVRQLRKALRPRRNKEAPRDEFECEDWED